MLAFIDESGDVGMKLDSGSSQLFTITVVGFADFGIANKTDSLIESLRIKMGIKSEFKFSRLSSPNKLLFFQELAECDFSYWSVVINKAKLSGKGFQYKDPFYKYACKLVCLNARESLENSIVVIDGSGSREFRQQFQSYLKKNVNDKEDDCPKIKKVKIAESHKNNLLQLADMVCGAVARSYTEKSDSNIYRKILSKKERSVQFWSK